MPAQRLDKKLSKGISGRMGPKSFLRRDR